MILIDPDILSLAKRGDDRSKVAVCLQMIPAIRKISWYIPPEWKDDALQSGFLAVLTAIGKYDPDRSGNFSFFAGKYVGNEVAGLFNSCVGICRIPRKIMVIYNEERKKTTPAMLPNGMKVDDIERLLNYTSLKNAE